MKAAMVAALRESPLPGWPSGRSNIKDHNDLRTLAQAEEIKMDKGRMAACQKLAKERMTQMQAAMGMPDAGKK